MESNHVAGEPANAVRGPVLDVVNDFGPARCPEVSDMFRARCCNVTLGWMVMIALFSAGHLVAGGAVTEAQALDRFLAQTNRGALGGATVEMDIEACLPKLQTCGQSSSFLEWDEACFIRWSPEAMRWFAGR
jgi:hypothetical protein